VKKKNHPIAKKNKKGIFYHNVHIFFEFSWAKFQEIFFLPLDSTFSFVATFN
jgi:hypothetical protein